MANIKINRTGMSVIAGFQNGSRGKATLGCTVTAGVIQQLDPVVMAMSGASGSLTKAAKWFGATQQKSLGYGACLKVVQESFEAADQGQKTKACAVTGPNITVGRIQPYERSVRALPVSSGLAERVTQQVAMRRGLYSALGLSYSPFLTLTILRWISSLTDIIAGWLKKSEKKNANGASTDADAESSTLRGESQAQGEKPRYKEGERVVDYKHNEKYKSYVQGNLSGYTYQCVSYASVRCKEVLGINKLIGLNLGKDVTKAFIDSGKTQFGEYVAEPYEIPGNITETERIQKVADLLKPNALVSFDGPTNAGHVVFVEDVVKDNGKTYVYFSEGGSSVHSRSEDGIIIKLEISEFVNRGEFSANGFVNFSKQ